MMFYKLHLKTNSFGAYWMWTKIQIYLSICWKKQQQHQVSFENLKKDNTEKKMPTKLHANKLKNMWSCGIAAILTALFNVFILVPAQE